MLRFSPQSVRDIEIVLAFTLEHFGESQRAKYQKNIREVLEELVGNPQGFSFQATTGYPPKCADDSSFATWRAGAAFLPLSHCGGEVRRYCAPVTRLDGFGKASTNRILKGKSGRSWFVLDSIATRSRECFKVKAPYEGIADSGLLPGRGRPGSVFVYDDAVNTQSSRDFLIDTDTASDDAVALIMALRSPGVVMRGITVVAGNVNLAQATANALYVTELCGAEVPVYAGCDRPMLRPVADATWFHGRDGLGDLGFAPVRRKAETKHAVDAMLELSRRYPGITLVTLGPLTNIAVALLRDPSLAKRVGRCVIMGGNPCCIGNVTPAAEYNIWCDPEAAEIVLRSGMAIELVGWNLCRFDAVFKSEDISRVRSIDSPLSRFAVDCNRTAADAYQTQTGEIGIALPDPTAMAIAIDPSIATFASSHAVMIECHSDLTRGQTIVDQLNVTGDAQNESLWSTARAGPPARVVWSLDIAGFKRIVLAALGYKQ